MKPPRDDVSLFCVIFTRAVIAWNNVEEAARDILSAMSHGGIGAEVAILHLGNVALKDAMLAMADISYSRDHGPSAIACGHVEHFVEGMDILRAYRNFYVHSLVAVGDITDSHGSVSGLLHTKEARGKLAWIQQNLSTDALAEFALHAVALREYGKGIVAFLKFANIPREARSATWPPWPEKPTWPEKLTKNRDYLRAPLRQPPASET